MLKTLPKLGDRRRAALIAAVAAVVVLVITAMAVSSVINDYFNTKLVWTQRLTTVSDLVAAHARQSLNAGDLILQRIVDLANSRRIRNQDELRSALVTTRIFETLQDAALGAPQVDVVTIVALNGEVVNFSRSFPPPPINLADRDYFKAHLHDQHLGLYIGRSVQNRGNGTWTFYLTRKLVGVDGSMQGLVLVGLHVSFFTQFFSAIAHIANHVSLRRNDGVLLARYPQVDELFSRSRQHGTPLSSLAGGATQNVTVTSAPSVGMNSGVLRMIVAQRVPSYDVTVEVSERFETMFAEWKQRSIAVAILIFALDLSIALIAYWATKFISALEDARRQALEAAEFKAFFVANISHEIRNPLNAIIGGVEMLADYDLPAKANSLVATISRSSRHLLSLINDVLDFSKLEARRVAIENTQFELARMIENVVDISRALPNAGRISITTRLDERLPSFVGGDAGRISQVLLNLLSNAIKFTDEGEIEIAVKRVLGDPGKIRFEVNDQGTGISAVAADQLFQPFSQSTGNVKGTGLGLAISKRLVDLMGGTIEGYNRTGGGATFAFTLPLEDCAPARIQRPMRPVEKGQIFYSFRTLVAEDVAANRMILELMLQRLGCSVHTVVDGAEAFMMAKEHVFDIIFLDNQMPEMNGDEVCRRLRADLANHEQPLIVGITASSEPSRLAALRASGMDEVIVKPVTSDAIEDVLRLASIRRMQAP